VATVGWRHTLAGPTEKGKSGLDTGFRFDMPRSNVERMGERFPELMRAEPFEPGKDESRASVVSSGRFPYIDDRGVRRGLRNTTVELWNEDPLFASGVEGQRG
jgi:hypothetical protein